MSAVSHNKTLRQRHRRDLARRAFLRRHSHLETLESRSLMATLNTFATTEHVDLNVLHSGGTWSIQPQIEGVPNTADNVLLYVGKSAEEERPAGTNFNFIGVAEGADFYRLPANQNPDALYAGFAGQGVPSTIDRYSPATESKGRITFNSRYAKVTLADVKHFNANGTSGDGVFSVWEDGPGGPKVFMSNYNDGVANPDGAGLDSTDGISADDALWILSGSHNHFNFGFSRPGRYEVDVVASAYMTDDGLSTPNTASFSQGAPIRLYFSVLNVGQLEFDAASYTVNEGAGTASINVRRVGGSDGQITTQFATTSGGTATITSDYSATSGTVTFLDQETVKTVTFPIINDTQDEPNETVNLVLSNPGPASIADYVIRPETDNRSLLGTQTTATLTIVDNDDPSNMLPTISDVVNQTTDEDTVTGAIAFTVSDLETADGDLVVTVASSNTTLVPNANIVLGGSGANRTVTLTPAANQFGTTTITLTITDGGGLTATDTFVLTVNSVNDLPTISDVANQTTNEETPTGAIAFTIGDLETAPGTLGVTATSSNTTLVPNANIVLAGSGANRAITLTPAANQFGTTTITLTVTDAGGLTATDTFVLTVNSVNDAPTISDVANTSTNEDVATGAIAFTVGDVETAAGDLVVTATSSNTTLVPNANIVLGGSGANRTMTLTPASNQSGTTTITLTVTDAGGLTATDTFILNVSDDNDFPTISDVANQTTNEDTPTGAIAFTIGDFETLPADLTVTATSSNTALVPNANIVLGGSGASRTVMLTPAANQFGTTTITLTVTDAGGLSATDTFVLTVNLVNDLPTISDVPDQTTNENTPTGAIAFTVGDVETPSADLNVLVTSSNTTLVPSGNIVLGGSGANRTVTLTPASNQFGVTTITLTVTDAGGLAVTDTFVLMVNDVTFAPSATDDVYTVNPGSGLRGNVLFNDTDLDGDTLTAAFIASPTKGSLVLNPNGTFTYTPDGTFNGLDSFTYMVSDGNGGSDTGTVTIVLPGDQRFEAAISAGHVDIGVAYEDDAWDLHVHDEENDAEYEAYAAILHVGSAAITSRTGGLAGTQFDFIGVAAGQTFYQLPDSENPELPFLGLGTEEIEDGTFLGGQLQLRLKAVNGPGHFSVWQNGPLGPAVTMASFDGITADDFAMLQEASHAHYNFAFTARGNYEVTFEAFGTLADGTEVSSGDETYRFVVNSGAEAGDDGYSVDEDTTLTVGGPGVLGNDADPDGDSLVSTLVAGPANGTVTVNADGSFTYVPNANFSGTDTFTYAVTDTRYRIVPLGTLGGNNSFALDVNNHRQVSGNSSVTAGSSNPLQAYLWQNGEFVPLGVLPGTGTNNFSRGYAVNDDSVVVGESDNNTSFAFVYENGVMSGLLRLAGDNFRGVSNDINNSGVIVGSSSNGTASRPTIWTFDGVTYVAADLGTIRGTPTSTGRAWAINDAGDVVGLSHNIDGTSQATLWSGGTITNLTSLGDGLRFSQAFGLNGTGLVVGSSSTGQTVGQLIGTTSGTGITRAFVWHDGHMHELLPVNFYAPGNTGTTTNYHSVAMDVNDAGIVVGNSQRIAGSAERATIWFDETALDLNSLIPTGSGWTLRSAEGINQSGDIVGSGSFGGFTRAFLLVPEVTSLEGQPFSSTATVTITVNPVADAPLAVNDAYVVGQGSVVHGNVLFNDSDPDGDALTAAIATQPVSGSVSFNSNGSFVYTPGGSFAGSDSFTYTVEDSTGATATATVTISAAQPQDFEVILTIGHADIGLFISDGDTIIDHGDHTHTVDGEPAWDLHVHDGENDEEYAPDQALFYVGPQALTTRSNGLELSDYDFLGVAAGQPLYILPATENPELLFLGIGTEEIEVGTLVGGTAQINLVSVNGPGQLSLWQFTAGAPNLAFATSDGVTQADTFTVLEGGHTHYNWGFTAPGRYEVTIEAAGAVVGHDELTKATATYYFSVDSLGRIQLTESSYSVDEAGNVTLTVERVGGSDGPLTVDYATAGGTATAGTDFAAFAGSLAFADGETSKTIVFAASPDSNAEGLETTVVSLTAGASSPVEFGTPASATITIVDGSPIANPQSVSLDEDGSLPITLTGSDPQGSALTFEVVSGPANGTLTGTGANRVYTPNANFAGTDSFTFKVNDGASDSETVTVQITVNPVNDTPTVSNIADQATNEDTATGAITFIIGDVETAAGSLLVTATSSNTAVVPNGSIVLGGSGANRTVTLNPAANQFGTTTITITVTDAGGLTAIDTFVLTVNGVNDAPTISNVVDLATNEDTATAAIPFTVGDVETAAGDLIVTATSSNTALVSNANIVFAGTGANRTVTLTPAANQSGTTTITVTVTDAGLTATDTFVLTVNAVNDAPTISNVADQTTNEDVATAAISFLIGDVETATSALTVTATSSNTALVPSGSIVLSGAGANRTLTLTPAANQSGTTTIALTVTDAGGLTATDTFVLTVSPVNDAPTLDAIANPAAIPPNSGQQTISLSGISAGGGESQTHTITATSSNPALIPNPTVNYTSPGATGSLTFAPIAGQTGTATITVTVTDDGGTTNGGVNVVTRSFTITVQTPATLDFGDAPNSYGTLLANNGPRHTVGPLFLGSSVTAEADGQPATTATGDVDNGVALPSGVLAGMTTTYTVTASQAGKLDAWIDFNRNGLFDANEKIADSISVVAGSNSLRFNTPLGASGGDAFARFRLSTAGGLSPLGAAADGEVEDYAVKIVSSTQPGAFVIPDPENPTRGLLVINGTAGTDVIRVVSTGGANGRTIVVAPMTSSLLLLNSSTFDRVLVRGGGGADVILFSPDFSKPATIYGDAGADVIVAGAGNDTIYGGAGIDTIRGGGGNDQIFGEGDIDFLYGEAGNDLIQGGDGADYIYGGAGADVLVGGNGSDFIYGDAGDDLIIGAKWKYDLDPTTLAAILQAWGSSSPFTTRVSALGSRLNSSSLSDDGTFDYIWTGSGRDWVHDAALRDLLLDFNYNVTSGDRRN